MTVLYALLAAFSNALNVTTQHKASISNPKKVRGWRLIPYLFTNPLWLFGWIALAGAFLFQALALHRGQMSVVQPLLVTELVFALVLRRLWIKQHIRPITWWAAACTCAALALFVAMSEPQGGNATPSSDAWLSASAAAIGMAVGLALLGMWGPPGRRAALLASATATLWALVATFIKTTTQTLSQFGLSGMFLHWPVYALAVAGLSAAILNQVTLHVGPLSVSQPFLVIVDPMVSIVLSVWIFEESFTANATRVTLAALSFVTLCAAVIVLTRTAPPTMDTNDAAGQTT
jgi:drug/metabolite transporter (DMT)-like permease